VPTPVSADGARRVIAVVNPNTTRAMTGRVVAIAAGSARPGTNLLAITPEDGAAVIETPADEVVGAMSVLQAVQRCERGEQVPDAYVVACFGDTGVHGARQVASGPVVGMTEAALMTAALLAHRFAVVTMPLRTIRQSDAVVRDLGFEHRCAVHAIDEPVAEVRDGSRHLLDAFAGTARRAVEHDNAEAVILGCAGLADLVGPLAALLGVPVIDGVAAAVSLAEGLIAQGLTTSRGLTWAPDNRHMGREVTV
jgi:allantoin racemase